MKVCAEGGVPKTTLGITGLLEILGRDYGIEKLYWGVRSKQGPVYVGRRCPGKEGHPPSGANFLFLM